MGLLELLLTMTLPMPMLYDFVGVTTFSVVGDDEDDVEDDDVGDDGVGEVEGGVDCSGGDAEIEVGTGMGIGAEDRGIEEEEEDETGEEGGDGVSRSMMSA